jgi:hypothetical protein
VTCGHASNRRRFTDDQVVEMRRMWRDGASWADIGVRAGLTRTRAMEIGTGYLYANVPEAITPAERRARYGRKK